MVISMQDAETRIIKAVQADHLRDEISTLTSLAPPGDPKDKAALSQKKRSMKGCSSLCKLDPFPDASGIVRVRGCRKHARLPEVSIFQLFCPKEVTLPISLSSIVTKKLNTKGEA